MVAALLPIHIVFTVDANYAMPLAATLCSIATNASREHAIRIHVMHDGFPENLRMKVAASLDAGGHTDATLEWHYLDLKVADHLRQTDVSQTVYMRLFIADCLPASVNKAIFLDADLIVLDDIALLWAHPLGGRILLAARDRIGVVSARNGIWNFKQLGIPPDAPYFNAGVLVLNLEKWRRDDVTARVLRYLGDHADRVKLADQGALNAVLFDNWAELDFCWNWQVVPDLRAAVAAQCWGIERTEKSIVHFVTAAKPWVAGSRYPERKLFFHYLDRTPWHGWRVPIMQDYWARLKRRLPKPLQTVSRKVRSRITLRHRQSG